MPKALLANGIKLHYQRVGQGPDMVLIHGISGNLATWHLQIVPLLLDHFQTLTYDLRGHGYSDAPPTGYTADDMADDLCQLLDVLEIERAYLVGHSWGADIALYFAYKYPERVREVAAIEAALPAMIYLRGRDEWAGWDLWSNMFARAGYPIPPERRTDVNYLLSMSKQVPKMWGPLAGLPRNPRPFDRLHDMTSIVEDYQQVGSLTLERLGDIEVPVLLIYDDGSAFMGTHDYLWAHLKQARSVILPGMEWGHFGPLEKPELIAECLLQHLASDSSAVSNESYGVSEKT